MKIAIVDDVKSERESVRLFAGRYFEERLCIYGALPKFFEFESGEAFLDGFSPGMYDIVFLDIYMDKMTGMDVAKRISCIDKSCSIIFSTTSEDHMLEGYSVHAAGYVLKPVIRNAKALFTAIDYATSRLQLDKAGISFTTEFGQLRIYCRSIVYVDCIGKSVYVHLADSTVPVEGRFSDYQDRLLSDGRFLECYRNLIVNMDYIDSPADCDFILKSGEKIPISRRKKTEVMKKYMRYFIGRRG